MTTVFLLDDHEIVRRGLRDLLEANGLEIVGEASTEEEALQRIPATRPDVAVLDVRLPDGTGVEVCRDLRSADPDLRCLMLTSYADDEALFDAVVAGAAGYVLKEVRSNDLVDAIRVVARGGSVIDPKVVDELVRARAQDGRSPLEHLTPREREVLAEMASGKSNATIAGSLFLSERAVEKHINSMFSKLHLVEEADVNRRVKAVLLYVAASGAPQS